MGPYTVTGSLGMGADARVYRAEGPQGRVALKVARNRAARHRIRDEARILTAHPHPHLARCIDVSDEGQWMAMELVEGQPFDQWARRRPVDEVVRVALELLGPLVHLAEAGLVHGDLRPAHVLVDDWGHPKLLDLGLASDEGRLGAKRLTLGFTAPEVLSGSAATAAADVYGYGATLYAALTGRAPFDVGDPAALVHLPQASSPVPASAWRIDIPARLDRLLNGMLARIPTHRPSLAEVVRSLTRLHHSAPARPVLGMVHDRMTLHEAVGRAAGGTPTAVVLYGPPGCGRRTLAQQAVRQARRDGMRYLDHASPDELASALRRGVRPVVVGRTRDTALRDATQRMLRGERTGLVILYGPRPLPRLRAPGAVQLTPEPLDRSSAALLAQWLGAPGDVVDDLWRDTEGHPRSLWLALEPHATRNTGDRKPFSLPRTTARILDALRQHRAAVTLETLSQRTRIPVQRLLDLVTMLEACDLVAFTTDGLSVRPTERPPPEP